MNSPSASSLSSPPAIKHVLIVDQQDMVRTILCTLLQSWGFTTRIAGNLIGACRMVVSDGPFDAIICNYELPDGNAFDLVQWMIDEKIAVPTVVPYGAIRPRSHMPENVKLVAKPLDPEELRNAIERAERGIAGRTIRPAGRGKNLSARRR